MSAEAAPVWCLRPGRKSKRAFILDKPLHWGGKGKGMVAVLSILGFTLVTTESFILLQAFWGLVFYSN